MNEQRTCTERGRAHRWEPKNTLGDVRRFHCPECTAWGWSSPWSRGQVRQYKEPFALNERDAEPTALDAASREDAGKPRASTSYADIDRRTDRWPLRGRRTRTDYVPRFTLDDWDRGDQKLERMSR